MQTYKDILGIAVERHGADALEQRWAQTQPLANTRLRRITDDRWLSAMAKRIFAAGFVWKVVDAKWSGFEEAFHGFDPSTVAGFDETELAALQQDTRIIRNGQKIAAVVQNAELILDIAKEHGSFGGFVAAWDATDPAGLHQFLAGRGSRLGGNTGPYLLRFMGVDTYLLSKDVVARLNAEKVFTGSPSSKGSQRAIQAAFNQWREESGQSYNTISITLAMSIDG